MIRVFLCDDDPSYLEYLSGIVGQFFQQNKIEAGIKTFLDGETLLEEPEMADLVFLDVEMPQMDGMKAAEKIRETDEEVILIFITNMAKYAIRGYEVQALDYVLKPVKYEAFSVKMDKVKRLAEKKKDKSISIKTGTATHRLLLSHIQYVEVVQHLLIFHTEDGDFSTRGVLKDVEAVLEENGFYKCNKCYLVNLRHVRSVHDGMALVGNDQLQVSRARKKAFAEAVADYIGNMQSI